MLELRDYQADTLDRSAAALDRGVLRQLWVLATGLGKTVIFCELIARRGGRALVLAHRDTLIAQAVAKLLESRDDYRLTPAAARALRQLERADLLDKASAATGPIVGIVQAADDDTGADIVVASVQTLSQPHRLARLVDPEPTLLAAPAPFATVVVDEAHHSTAPSYVTVLTALRAGEPDGPLLVGVTATPDRGDGRGLDDAYDEVVAHYDTLWGIRNGYLCDVRAVQVKAGVGGIVAAWNEYAAGRPTLVFCRTVADAHRVANDFMEDGTMAVAIDQNTPMSERMAAIRQLERDELHVIVNCEVFTEGTDIPIVSCIGMARDTESRALYAQIIGRGLRRHPAKQDCLVLDVVGTTERHNLVTVPSLFGIDGDPRARNGTERVSRVVADHADELVAAGSLDATEAELFKNLPSSSIVWLPAVNPASGLDQWMRPLGRVEVGGQYKELPTVVLVRRDADTDEWVAGLWFPDGTKRVLIDRVPLTIAQGVGEDYARKHASNVKIVLADAAWRAAPPTARAVAAARLFHVQVEPTWNAGQLADAIDHARARRRGLTTTGAPR